MSNSWQEVVRDSVSNALKGGGGGKKPPKPPRSGGLCIQIAPWVAWPALAGLAAVIVKSLT